MGWLGCPWVPALPAPCLHLPPPPTPSPPAHLQTHQESSSWPRCPRQVGGPPALDSCQGCPPPSPATMWAGGGHLSSRGCGARARQGHSRALLQGSFRVEGPPLHPLAALAPAPHPRGEPTVGRWDRNAPSSPGALSPEAALGKVAAPAPRPRMLNLGDPESWVAVGGPSLQGGPAAPPRGPSAGLAALC